MVKVAGPQDVGQVSPSRLRTRSPQVPAGAFDTGAAELAQAGGQLFGVGERLAVAEKKVRDRNDALDRVKKEDAFKSQLDEMTRDVLLQEDPSSPVTLKAAGETFNVLKNSVIEEHRAAGASEQSLFELDARLSRFETGARDSLAAEGFKVSQEKVTTALNTEINRLAATVSESPSEFENALDEFTDTFERMAPHLSISNELKTRQFGQQALVMGVIDNLLLNAEPEEARDFISQPGIAAFITPDAQRAVQKRIRDASKVKDEKLFVVNGNLVDAQGGVRFSAPREPKEPRAQQTQTLLNPETGRTRLVNMTAPDAAAQIAQAAADGFTVEANFAPNTAEGLTARSQSQRELQVRQAEEVTDNLGNIITQMEADPGVVGLGGAAKSLSNNVLAQFSPRFFDENRAQFEQLVNVTRQMALRATSDESRFSETDRVKVEQLFPSTGPLGSPEGELLKARILRIIFVKRGLAAGEDIGSLPQLDVTIDDLVQGVQDGAISQADAERAADLLFPDGVEAPQ